MESTMGRLGKDHGSRESSIFEDIEVPKKLAAELGYVLGAG